MKSQIASWLTHDATHSEVDFYSAVAAHLAIGDMSTPEARRMVTRVGLSILHWARIQRQKDVFPFLRLNAGPVHLNGHCSCNPICGVLLPVDHPFWQSHFPPNDQDCACSAEQVSVRKMQKEKWDVTGEHELPSADSIPEPYRRNWGSDLPTDWSPGFVI